jgi:hypothetical protein
LARTPSKIFRSDPDLAWAVAIWRRALRFSEGKRQISLSRSRRYIYSIIDSLSLPSERTAVQPIKRNRVLATEELWRPPAFAVRGEARLAARIRRCFDVYIPYDYWRFTPSSLSHVLGGAGFTDIVVASRGNRSPSPRDVASRRLPGLAVILDSETMF